MNPKVAARQARLLQMLESKEEIRIGRERDCPLPLPQLVRLTEDHPDVVKVYGHGLTAEVFQARQILTGRTHRGPNPHQIAGDSR